MRGSACALRSAQLLNEADFARDVGVAPSTAKQWLAILQATGQLFEARTTELPNNRDVVRGRD